MVLGRPSLFARHESDVNAPTDDDGAAAPERRSICRRSEGLPPPVDRRMAYRACAPTPSPIPPRHAGAEQASLAFTRTSVIGLRRSGCPRAIRARSARSRLAVRRSCGVIDTGADLDHGDLLDNLVPVSTLVDGDTTPDLPNVNDDDSDGFIDEATGTVPMCGIAARRPPIDHPIRFSIPRGTGGFTSPAASCRDRWRADVINLSLSLE